MLPLARSAGLHVRLPSVQILHDPAALLFPTPGHRPVGATWSVWPGLPLHMHKAGTCASPHASTPPFHTSSSCLERCAVACLVCCHLPGALSLVWCAQWCAPCACSLRRYAYDGKRMRKWNVKSSPYGQTWASGAWWFASGRAWSNMGFRCVVVCIGACVVKHGLQVRGGLHQGVRGQTWAAGAWWFASGRAWSNMGCRCVEVCIGACVVKHGLQVGGGLHRGVHVSIHIGDALDSKHLGGCWFWA